MTREEIYEHLAKVYLGKKKNKKKNYNLTKIILFINLILLILLPAIFFIKTNKAVIAIKQEKQEESVSLALNYYPLRLVYNFKENSPQVRNFSLYLPSINLENSDSLKFSIRGYRNGFPRIIKIALENRKKEKSVYYLDDINTKWQNITIDLSEFKEISDWTNITKLSFIIEAWNTDNNKCSVLIDDVRFYSKGQMKPKLTE
ncbi:MAG: hypothetical protein FJZ11_03260 [Candidatus Omnitrophica bacterium]|nr:hypothetical protein [Candidatus Omnitrophota bacterium]